MGLSVDKLFALAEAAPLLDEAEAALRAAGRNAAANQLSKLQEDAGVQIDREFGGEASGPESARLYEAYEPVTAVRFNKVLNYARAQLPPGDVKDKLKEILPALLVPEETPRAPTPATRRTPGM